MSYIHAHFFFFFYVCVHHRVAQHGQVESKSSSETGSSQSDEIFLLSPLCPPLFLFGVKTQMRFSVETVRPGISTKNTAKCILSLWQKGELSQVDSSYLLSTYKNGIGPKKENRVAASGLRQGQAGIGMNARMEG